MRWMQVLLLSGCGGDPLTSSEADAMTVTDGARTDDAAAPADSSALTLCDEANAHSDLTWLEANVFVPRCAGCHGGAEPDANLILSAGQVRANLVGVTPSTVGTPWVRVQPGSIEDSYLMVALGQTAGPAPSLGFMPLGQPALCAEIHAAIGRWITNGAP
jgi:hypothetical protein